MAVKFLTYTAIPDSRRRAAGQRILLQLRDGLRNPVLSPAQRETIMAEIDRINAWVGGRMLPIVQPKVEPVTAHPDNDKAVHHKVTVVDGFAVVETPT